MLSWSLLYSGIISISIWIGILVRPSRQNIYILPRRPHQYAYSNRNWYNAWIQKRSRCDCSITGFLTSIKRDNVKIKLKRSIVLSLGKVHCFSFEDYIIQVVAWLKIKRSITFMSPGWSNFANKWANWFAKSTYSSTVLKANATSICTKCIM